MLLVLFAPHDIGNRLDQLGCILVWDWLAVRVFVFCFVANASSVPKVVGSLC